MREQVNGSWRIETHPKAEAGNVLQGDCWRISILTEGLIRLEYQPEGCFEDRATQMVWNRDFPPTGFQVQETDAGLEIFTSRIHLIYNRGEFSSNGLSIQVMRNLSPYHSIWRYGQDFEDLKGTARTLDLCDGETELDRGIIGKNGFSVLDDSDSLVLTEDGWVEPRQSAGKDLYFWGYGHDYREALKDFYYLCGKSPMVPRYALGNWWSRYYKYTEQSYKALMERFKQEGIPFSVAVIDMDWHLVDIDPKYGSGWTGYTWNKELFPDPQGFLQWLHGQGLRVTLNLHPADGIRAYEDIYPQMAEELGANAEKEQPVNFDAASPEFLQAYFKYFTHPQEAQGVDFWWIDWQSGGVSRVKGLDPLWILNHYHYLDYKRDGRRPMIFSRYAGPGSHRYPVGFSGDTIVSWASLAFQPYFTAAASNIGYGMWSHDIGGHMHGTKEDEMAGRWLQFGVFSPIMRLHSSCSPFNGKEPWRYKTEVRDMMEDFLRLRHRLVPYLYTMNYRAYAEDTPLMLPMYYEYPEEEAAYQVPNEYIFGNQLLAAPVTTPRIPGINVSKTRVWLPKGMYFDIFTGARYQGGRMMDMYRTISSIPVLAKAGAILTLADEKAEAGKNPEVLFVHVYPGADGSFVLYEDDNETEAYREGVCAQTAFSLSWGTDPVLTIEMPQKNTQLLPQKREYVIVFHGIGSCEGELRVGEKAKHLLLEERQMEDILGGSGVCVSTGLLDPAVSRVELCLKNAVMKENDSSQYLFDFLNQAEISFDQKDRLYAAAGRKQDKELLLSELMAMDLEPDLLGAVMEILTA